MADSRIEVWLDCDPGHDDAFAILLAAYHPSVELLGISTVHGNSSVVHTTKNAGSILTAIGRPEVPVYPGAGEGLIRPAVHAPAIHGESGLDGTDLLPPPAVPAVTDIPAIDAMAKAIFATSTGTAWLVATGTLTNIAQLITKYPTIVEHIKGLSIMGGAIGGGFTAAPMGKIGAVERFGNWTPYAEFNIVCDPEASYAVFSNPVLATKTNLIPLDVTHQVLATQSVQDLLLYGPSRTASPSSPPSQLRVMLIELINFFAETYASVFGITAGPPLHDPLALAVILDGIAGVEMPFYDFIGVNGEKGRNERYAVNIISEGTHAQAVAGETQTGRTVATLLPDGAEGVKIPRSLNVERFWDVLEVCLQRADEKNAVLGVK